MIGATIGGASAGTIGGASAGTIGGASAGAAKATEPSAPTVTSVKAVGLNSIAVAFAAGNDGGARIAIFQATCISTDGGVTGAHDATKSPIRVPSLTGNATYTCSVTATNAVGTGPASTPSSPAVVRPKAPAAPTITSVKAVGLRSITVAFTKPADNGGAPITNYRASCTSSTGGAPHAREAAQSTITVSDLTAAQTYTCTVAADNRVGLGPASLPSAPVIARPTAPGAPTITSVRAAGRRSILVAVTAPSDNGGARITHYVVVCRSSDGGAARNRAAFQSPIRVAGLTPKKTYTCTVAASNNVRLGPASAPSKPVVVR